MSLIQGFTEHVVSSALEWAMAFLSAVYFASFYREFRHFTLAMPVEFTVMHTAEVKDNVNGDLAPKELQHASFTVSTLDY